MNATTPDSGDSLRLDDLQAYVELMNKHGLVELKVQEEGRKIHLKKATPQAPTIYAAPMGGMAHPGMMPAAASPEAAAADARAHLVAIKSPIVGTFYRASSPEAEPFVEVGTKVTPESTVCILEAMKVMNEIKAEISGVVREIMVENGQPVEFGGVLFYVEPE